MKSPYSFPARTRGAMINTIESIMNRRSYDYQIFPFCWDVKLHHALPFEADKLNADHYDGGTFNPAWDDEWAAEMDKDWFFYNLIEDMRRPFTDGTYSTYPGDNEGELEFEFQGRGGGWLCLVKAYGRDMRGLDIEALNDKDEWPMDDIRKLYQVLVCLNQDITGKTEDAVKAEARFHIAFQRAQWEKTRQEQEEARNAAIAEEYYAARPDLAPAYTE